MILDCDRLWTRLVSAVYRLRRLPRVTDDPPPVARPAEGRPESPAAGRGARLEPDPRAESSEAITEAVPPDRS